MVDADDVSNGIGPTTKSASIGQFRWGTMNRLPGELPRPLAEQAGSTA